MVSSRYYVPEHTRTCWVIAGAVLYTEDAINKKACGRVPSLTSELGVVGPDLVEAGETGVDDVCEALLVDVLDCPVDVFCAALAGESTCGSDG